MPLTIKTNSEKNDARKWMDNIPVSGMQDEQMKDQAGNAPVRRKQTRT
jgi:hypothetical protein